MPGDTIQVGFIETQKSGFSVSRTKAEQLAIEKHISIEAAAVMLATQMSENDADYCEPESRDLVHIDDDSGRELIEAVAGEIDISCAGQHLVTTDPVQKLVEQYVAGVDDRECPFCDDPATEGEGVDIQGTEAHQELSCACGANWTNVYRLDHIIVHSFPEEFGHKTGQMHTEQLG